MKSASVRGESSPREPLRESVRLRMRWRGSGVSRVEVMIHLIECLLELAASIGQRMPQPPAYRLELAPHLAGVDPGISALVL